MASPKQPLAEAVCQQLREAILAQRWRNTLPGIRVLCEEIEVSRQTMMLALRLLEGEGYVLPAESGKPRAINQDMVQPTTPVFPKKSQPTIVVIARHSENRLSESDAQVCNHLRKLIVAQNYVHRHVAFRYVTRAMGGKRIDHLIEQNPADVYVVIGAHQQCSKALKRQGVPVVYIGGALVKGCTPRISYSLSQMANLALEHLVSAGHTKISVMLPEVLNLSSKKQSLAEKIIGRLFQDFNLPFSTYNCPRWGKTKCDFNTALEQLFSLTPPTALILGDAKQVPRTVSFLMRHNLKYPDDISIVVFDEAKELQEYQPPVSYLKKQNRSLAKLALNSVRKKLASQPDQDLIISDAQLIVTDSIAELHRK